jgi:hypothetical protein
MPWPNQIRWQIALVIALFLGSMATLVYSASATLVFPREQEKVKGQMRAASQHLAEAATAEVDALPDRSEGSWDQINNRLGQSATRYWPTILAWKAASTSTLAGTQSGAAMAALLQERIAMREVPFFDFGTKCYLWNDPNQPAVHFFSIKRMALNQAMLDTLQVKEGDLVLIHPDTKHCQLILSSPQSAEEGGANVLCKYEKKGVTYLCLESSDEITTMPWVKPEMSFKAEQLGHGLRQAKFSADGEIKLPPSSGDVG